MALIPRKMYADWEPFEGMRNMQDRINRLFDQTFGSYPAIKQEPVKKAWSPLVDIYEGKDTIIVKVELPGVQKEDVSIELQENTLTLSGERKHEVEVKEGKYHRIERFYGAFSRSFTLPDIGEVEKVRATYKDGVLEIALPKSKGAAMQAIPIKAD